MIKRFSSLGDVVDRLSPDGSRSTSALPDGSRVVVDLARDVDVVRPVQLRADGPVPLSTIPGPVRLSVTDRSLQTSLISSDVRPQSFSKESSLATFETLFHDFNLTVEPVYNFWVEDELTNDSEERGKRSLEDVPRYVRISWSPAPVVVSPGEEERKSKMNRPINPPLIGVERTRGQGFSHRGSSFAPSHLQPSGFSLIKRSLANGHVAPGTISSVVELPVRPVAEAHKKFSFHEQSFLESQQTRGISPHELLANVSEVIDGNLDQSWLVETPVRASVNRLRGEMFDGKFALNRSLVGRPTIVLQGVQSSSPSLSIVSSVARSLERRPPDPVASLAADVTAPPVDDRSTSRFNRVRFIDPAIDGALSSVRIDSMVEPHHAESVVALAQNISNLEVLSRTGFEKRVGRLDAPSFPSPAGLPALEYVGYVIEKYQLVDGSFKLVGDIDIVDREIDSHVDTRVVYGGTYRYRMRTIVRWTRPVDVSFLGKDTSVIPQFGSQTQGAAPYKSSYFGSEWSDRWAHATVMDLVDPPPPDELTVRPESARMRVCVTAKFPENSQRDIFMLKLLRKLQDGDGKDLTTWAQVGPDFGPGNFLFYDTDVEHFQRSGHRYVYAAQCVSRHHEWSTLSEQLGCRLNRDHRLLGEYPVDFVSCAGVRPEYFGTFSVSPPRRTKEEVVLAPPDVMSLVDFTFTGREGTSRSSYGDRDYVVRVESLDTGETVDVPVGVRYASRESVVSERPVLPVVGITDGSSESAIPDLTVPLRGQDMDPRDI